MRMTQEDQGWGFFSRLTVAALAGMVIALALKPYSMELTPLFNKIKLTSAKLTKDSPLLPNSTGPNSFRARLADPSSSTKPLPKVAAENAKPKDTITDRDKTQLKAVLDKL